jgi:hypothetical protein
MAHSYSWFGSLAIVVGIVASAGTHARAALAAAEAPTTTLDDPCAGVPGDWDATIDDGSAITSPTGPMPVTGTAMITIGADDVISHATLNATASTPLGPLPISADVGSEDLKSLPALACSGGRVTLKATVTVANAPNTVDFAAPLVAGTPLRAKGTATVTDANGQPVATFDLTLTHR